MNKELREKMHLLNTIYYYRDGFTEKIESMDVKLIVSIFMREMLNKGIFTSYTITNKAKMIYDYFSYNDDIHTAEDVFYDSFIITPTNYVLKMFKEYILEKGIDNIKAELTYIYAN